MKKITLAVFIFALSLTGFNAKAQGTQPDNTECFKYMSYYQEYYKQKNYDEAIPSWRKAYSICPANARQNLYIEGATLVKRLINKNSKNKEYKAALVDTLMTLYKTRIENYPKSAITAWNNMGLDMSNFVKDDPNYLYENYEKIIEATQASVRPRILLFDLQAAVELFQGGALQTEDVIDTYQRNNDLLEQIQPKDDKDATEIASVKNDMGSVFAASKVASCESLLELYTPRLAADPDNLALATTIAKTMTLTDGCTDNDLFLKAVTVMNKQNPSASSSYYLYRLHSARGNVDEAIDYMLATIASEETDAVKDAEYTYELATFCYKNSRNAKAFEYANQAASMDEKFAGKAYFLIGNIWAGTRCGGDEIAVRAPMWVACDYMAKAKNADPSLTDEANRYIGQYSAYFPKAEDAFMYDIQNGQSYTVVCGGMRATTTVRTSR